jgi:hypothetical protein
MNRVPEKASRLVLDFGRLLRVLMRRIISFEAVGDGTRGEGMCLLSLICEY